MNPRCACGCGCVLRVTPYPSRQPQFIRGHHRVGRKCAKPYANKRDVSERFWDKVDKTSSVRGCWLWRAGTDGHGYGQVSVDQRPDKAHRVSWRLAHGPIPSGLWVLHRCDTPACVNPTHLFLGTQLDNMQDAAQKGRVRVPCLRGNDHPNAKLTADQARAIYLRSRDGGETSRQIANDYGVSRDTVLSIGSRRGWRHTTEGLA